MATQHKFRCIIAVRGTKRVAANNFWKNNIDLIGGDKTFTQGLSSTGNLPATWFWCSTVLEKWQLVKVVQVADANSSDIRIVIWAYRGGLKQDLIDAMNGRAYISIIDSKQDITTFLTASGMKVIRQNG